MVENVLLSTEMVQGFNKCNISPRGLLEVNLPKAFDSVRWDFTLQILATAEFPPIFITGIRECLTTTSFSINLNTELFRYFRGKRSLSKGDPPSIPLFVMAMESFSNLLSSKYEQGILGTNL